MDHQDWKPVVLRKPAHVVAGGKKSGGGGGGGPKPPKEGDEFKLPKIGVNLKVAIMQARVAKKMSQKELAQKLGVPPDIINKYKWKDVRIIVTEKWRKHLVLTTRA